MQRGLFVIIIGPGGVGKDTLLKRLVAEDPNFTPIVSYTTRAPRPGEQEGVAYRFVDLNTFAVMAGISYEQIADSISSAGPDSSYNDALRQTLEERLAHHQFGEFLEFVNFRNNYYGSSRVEIEGLRDAGKDVAIIMDTQGADAMMRMGLDPTTVFILPPSMEVLRDRASGRGFEDPTVFEGRMQKAEQEIQDSVRYDHRIVNDDLDAAMAELHAVVERARSLNAPTPSLA